MEKLVLIDGNSLINRAFYAMPLLSTKDGLYTNAVYGFMNMFFKMLSDIKPKYVAVAFDLKAPTFRHKMYAEYKGTRKPMADELRPQIPLLKELLNLMNVKTVEKEGIEADDIIGTIAKATDVKTIIFTGDKDSFQLVDEQTEVHFTKRGITDTEIYTLENFVEKNQITPAQIIELKALMGDSSDNIPGVSGIGEKTAKALLNEFGSIDNIYANTDKLKGKIKEKIEMDKEKAYLSKTLATINCDCGVDTDLDKMLIHLPFSSEVKDRFAKLEFKTLVKKEQLFESSSALDGGDGGNGENGGFAYSEETQKVNVITINDIAMLPRFTDRTFIVIDERKVHVSDEKNEYVLNIAQTLLDDGLNLSEILRALEYLFTGTTPLVVFNKKALKHFLKDTANIMLSAPCDDLALIKYLADFSGREESLDDVLLLYDMPNETKATSLALIYNELYQKLKDEDMLALYEQVELPLSDILFDMEVSGFKVDYTAICDASEKYRVILDQLEGQIKDLSGEPNLNVNSPKQLGDLLFEKLKIGKGKKTKTGYSTTAEILESFEDAHPIVPLILKHRRIQKIQSTYVEGFKPLIEKKTGLLHTTFNQALTATGRLSSKEPNLQNIPVRDDEGREIRKFFVPKSEDRILMGADYSQIELRLLASFSGCKALIDAFNSGKDVHADTASKVFNVPIDEVTPLMRSNAKAVNFGIIYGMSEYGLAKNINVSNNEAREYIRAYFEEFPEVKAYMDANVAFAKENGYAKTLLGRRRYIKEINSSNFNLRMFGERVAMNMPLQGSSADIIKVAMIKVAERLKKENLKSELILQVHDELIIDAFIDEQEQVKNILVEEMEGAVNLNVKLTVSCGSGKTWFDAK